MTPDPGKEAEEEIAEAEVVGIEEDKEEEEERRGVEVVDLIDVVDIFLFVGWTP